MKDPLAKTHKNPEIIEILYDEPNETESIGGEDQTSVSSLALQAITLKIGYQEECLDKVRQDIESPRYSPIQKIVREESSIGPSGSKRYMPSYVQQVVTETIYKKQRFR